MGFFFHGFEPIEYACVFCLVSYPRNVLFSLHVDYAIRQFSASVAIRCTIEALYLQITYDSLVWQVSLVFQLAEVVPIHDDKFSAVAIGHYIVTLACFFVCVVSLSDSLLKTKHGTDSLKNIHSFM